MHRQKERRCLTIKIIGDKIMARENKIQKMIAEVANNKLAGKYNLVQYKEGGKRHGEKVKAMAHKKACEDIVKFMNEHKDIPFYFVLSVGVSKGAYKESEFNKGYKAFDAYKVLQVHIMGMEYLKYNGLEGKKMSDVAIRLIMRYYEKKSSDIAMFMLDLQNSKKLGKMCGSREVPYSDLCKNLNIPFGDETLMDKEYSMVG